MGHGFGQDAPGPFDTPIFEIVDQQSGRSPVKIGRRDAKAAIEHLIRNRSEPVLAISAKPLSRPPTTSKTNHPPEGTGCL